MTRLHVTTTGHGPDLVLLHGWGLHSGIWQFIVEKLSAQFRVSCVDLPGFGRSTDLCDYSLENIIAYLQAVTPAHAIWLGWSLGGLIATAFALSYPHRVVKLICVASTPKFVSTATWPGIDSAVLQRFNVQLKADYGKTLRQFLLLQFPGMRLNQAKMHWLDTVLSLYGRPSAHALNGGLMLLAGTDLRPVLHQLSCPLFYILGKRDTLVPERIKEALVQLHAAVQVTILPTAGHGLFLSHENEFITEVRHCLS